MRHTQQRTSLDSGEETSSEATFPSEFYFLPTSDSLFALR